MTTRMVPPTEEVEAFWRGLFVGICLGFMLGIGCALVWWTAAYALVGR